MNSQEKKAHAVAHFDDACRVLHCDGSEEFAPLPGGATRDGAMTSLKAAWILAKMKLAKNNVRERSKGWSSHIGCRGTRCPVLPAAKYFLLQGADRVCRRRELCANWGAGHE
ncbi:MAG TPA: hypothetical protein VMT39_01715 [Candidatus Bathyarchaeia archaeon]|nr:hypothetical protein [Candidatus Bathyarchaeia archaeon]